MQRFTSRGLAVALAALLLAGGGLAVAQEPPAHYAITGVRIVTGVGPAIESGTIVVRDGLIEAVGARVEVPAGAWTLDGSGLTAYPGLIDALSTLALPSELREPEGRRGRFGGGGGGGGDEQEFAAGPEDRPATFTWVRAADHLQTDDARLSSWREAGFTTTLATPDRGLIPGQAALVDLAGERANDMVVASPVAMMVRYDKGRGFGGFPNSLMGSIAYIKQTFFDAQHYQQAWSIYERSPVGLARPDYDRALEPMRGAMQANLPVLLPGVWAREIRRSMAIARDMGVRPIIYGAHQGYEAAGELAAARVPVIVSLDWPRADRDGDPEADESLQVLRLRDRAPTTPAALHAAGARFAFTSGGASAADALEGARLAVRAGLPADAALRAFTLGAAEIFGVEDRLGSIETGKIANLVLTDGDLFSPGTHVRMTVVDGHRFEFDAPEGDGAEAGAVAAAEAWEPVPMTADRGPVAEPDALLIRGGTVLTVSGEPIENGSVLVRDGRIAAVGTDIEAPAGAQVIDATGRYVMPGIIDAHSHIATEAVNEGSVAVSSMVGIEDVIDPDDLGIYRAAAGGVTSINVLHGSANPIGGNNAVLKMRWGAPASGLLFEGAPKGIKFALGENTKRDRSPERYPNSRMGVIDVIRQSFLDAQEYRTRQRLYEQALADGEEGIIPPRRDLKLDALVEILEGDRLVHAHSYRGDEILQLLRVAEEFGFRIRTLQHVLEGYRVADEIAEHGAGASTFSDWWGYKVEAYEAIPHNAALMNERGVLVSINSDSGEEMRHLNQEAAKTVRWGGASEADALKMITLNPAIQLGIDDRVGSIDVGKDADLVIFDGHPLSAYGVVQTTIIDGRIYFDREHDLQLRAAIAEEKARLRERQAAAAGTRGDSEPAGRPTVAGEEMNR